MVTQVSQGSGLWWGGTNVWRTNLTQGIVFTNLPSVIPGNTYTVLSNATRFGNNTGNARLRNNLTNANNIITFAGDSLTLTTNTDIRFKNITTPASTPLVANFPGVGGNPGLILSGGILGAGDDGNFFVGGSIAISNQSYLTLGENGGGLPLRPNRRFNISGVLSGPGNMCIFEACTNFPNSISNSANTFSGQWIVKNGWLQGATNNALGTNSITCDPQYLLAVPPFAAPTNTPIDISLSTSNNVRAMVEVNYLLNSAGVLTLTNGGIMRLHGEAVFSGAVIEGSNLPPGIHYYSELFATWPANFDDTGNGPNGSGALVVQPYGTPPPLPPTILKQPLNAFAYTDGVARFLVSASDSGFPPLTYQWRSNGVNITSSRFFGATNNILVISNPAPAEAIVNYDVVINNASFSVTSSVTTLTIVAPSGEAYEAAVRAAKPIAFYQLNEAGDPSTGTQPAYDYMGGFYGIYGTGAGNAFSGITGPQPTDGFPGFGGANAGLQTVLNVANNRVTAALPWNLNGNAVTITAWVNPSGGQNPNEGLVTCRSGTTAAGLCYATAAGGANLSYNWNGEPDTFNWNSGLAPTPGVWSFVALVVTPTDATIYVLNTNGTTVNGTISASRHVYPHIIQPFDGGALIGDDSAGTGGNRTFNGKIDDVAVFNRALSGNDLLTLYAAGSGTGPFGPNIAVQPVSLNLFQGQTAQFTGVAVGSDPLTYQWQTSPTGSGGPWANVSGGKFSGATTPALTIANADFTEAADYIVVAFNGSGSTTSSVANLAMMATNASPINVTLSLQEASGADWDIGLNSPGGNTNWSDFNPATYSAAQTPGNTYELLPGSRLRSPDQTGTSGNVYSTFPGRLLTVDGDSVWNVNPGAGATIAEIRFKQHTYGSVMGNVTIPHLVMNGGQLDVGNDFTLILNGQMDILTNTPINNDGGNDRGYQINSFLTGSGSIEYHGYNAAYQSNFVNNLNIAGNTNTFTGIWNIVTGTLLGTGNKALGTNHIFVGTNGAIETTYDLVNTNAYLVLAPGAKMFLHQTNRFKSAVVAGVSLPPGTNLWVNLNSNFPSSFPAVWAPKTGATNYTVPSGMIVVLSNASPLITGQPRSITNRGQQTATFTVTAVGGNPLGYQWRAGAAGSGTFTNVFNAGNISGATNATLTITNLTSANSGDYLVVVTNIYGVVTSSVARLTELPLPFITLQPVSTNSSGTLSASFFASALGDLPITYQWQAGAIGSGGPYTNVSGSQYIGGTTTNLVINSLAISNSADLIIIFSNAAGSVTSSVATLTVIDPLITQQPTPAGTTTLFQQQTAQWGVHILGTAPLISQWQGGVSGSGIFTNMVNGPRVSGATTTNLAIGNIDFPDAGDYRYIVSNISGSATSSVVSLAVTAVSPAENITMSTFEAAGADWDIGANTPGGNTNWSDLNPASYSAVAKPGSTYTLLPGARLRTPVNATNSIFPGVVLTNMGDGVFTNSPAPSPTNTVTIAEIRFKHGNPGIVYFKKLVMAGGQLDDADNGVLVLQGEMDILANTPIYVDNIAGQNRHYRIESWLTGSANIEWRDYNTALDSNGGLEIAGTTNTYSGTWHVFNGVLLGNAPNSLGTNSITVENGGALETTYDLNTPTANLVLNGQMFLHQNDTFRTVTISNYAVPAGTYTYAQWANAYPANFPASWNQQINSAVNTASGSITVLVGPTINPITMSLISQGNSLVVSGTNGIPGGHYFVMASTNLSLPKASWTRVATYNFDGSGNFNFTNAISPGTRQQFLQLQQAP
jgi:hypothetical protein